MKLTRSLKDKTLVVFDLDGTLTESKSALKPDMARLIKKLLEKKSVAIIGGGKYGQFQDQFVKKFKASPELLSRLFLFPTTSTSFWRYQNGWKNVYAWQLPPAKRKKIIVSMKKALTEAGYVQPKKIYGDIIEDRGTQVTFSAVGQKAPVRVKEEWNKNSDIRPLIMKKLEAMIPEFEIRRGGLTSVDVTKKGIDKGFGILQIEKHLHVPLREMMFVGDALYPGGNDYAAKRTGIPCVRVNGPEDTKKVITFLLKK